MTELHPQIELGLLFLAATVVVTVVGFIVKAALKKIWNNIYLLATTFLLLQITTVTTGNALHNHFPEYQTAQTFSTIAISLFLVAVFLVRIEDIPVKKKESS